MTRSDFHGLHDPLYEYEQVLAHFLNVKHALLRKTRNIPLKLQHTYLVFQAEKGWARDYFPRDFKLISKNSKDHLKMFLDRSMILHGSLKHLISPIPRDRDSLWNWQHVLDINNKKTVAPNPFKVIRGCPFYVKGNPKSRFGCVKEPTDYCHCKFIVKRLEGYKNNPLLR